MKYDVLVVDDETSLLRLIVQGLKVLPAQRPVGASTLGEALAVPESDLLEKPNSVAEMRRRV